MRFMLTLLVASLVVGCGPSEEQLRLDALEASVAELAKMKAQLASLQTQLGTATNPEALEAVKVDLAQLKATVAGLPAPFDPKPILDRLDAIDAKLSMVGTPKVPHIVVDKTGDDLGFAIAGDVVWSTKLNAQISVTALTPLTFAQPQCQGATSAQRIHQKELINTPTGRLFKVTSALDQFVTESFMDNMGNCHDLHDVVFGVAVTDTGNPNLIFPVEQLRIELR